MQKSNIFILVILLSIIQSTTFAQTERKTVIEYDPSDWNGYKDIFFEVKEGQKLTNYAGENSYTVDSMSGESIIKVDFVKNAKKNKIIKNGNGYYCGSDKLVYFPNQCGWYDIDAEKLLIQTLNEFVRAHKDLNLNNNSINRDIIKSLSLYDFIDQQSYFNCEAGELKEGYKDGEWFRFQCTDKNKLPERISLKDTTNLLIQGDSIRGINKQGFIYLNYKNGLLSGRCIKKNNYSRLEGEFVNNKPEGEWKLIFDCKSSFGYGNANDYRLMPIYVTIPFKDGLINGVINIYKRDTKEKIVSYLIKNGKFIAALQLWRTYTDTESISDSTKVKREKIEYVYFKGKFNEKTGEYIKTFYSPLGDTIDNMDDRQYPNQTNWRYMSMRKNIHQYKWDYKGDIIYEEKFDAAGSGFADNREKGEKTEWTLNNGVKITTTYKNGKITLKEFNAEHQFYNVYFNEKGDTTMYHSYKDGKPNGIFIRTNSDGGKDYYNPSNNIKVVNEYLVKHIEKGIVTVHNGFGYSTTKIGDTIKWENGKRQSLHYKKGLNEIYVVYIDNWKPKLIYVVDSLGNKVVENGCGYVKDSPVWHFGGYYLNGERTTKFFYILQTDKNALTQLKYGANRKIIKVSPSIYRIDYDIKSPNADGDLVICDTFPTNIKLLYAGMSNKMEDGIWKYGIKDKRTVMLYLNNFCDSFKTTIWISIPSGKEILSDNVKGKLYFQYINKDFVVKSIPVNTFLTLKQAAVPSLKRVSPINSLFAGQPDCEWFNPNAIKQRVDVGDFIVQREVRLLRDCRNDFDPYEIKRNNYEIEVKVISKNHTQYLQPVYYREYFDTDKANWSYLNYWPINWEYGSSTREGPNLLVFEEESDKEYFPKGKNEEEINIQVNVNEADSFKTIGCLVVGDKEYYIGSFSSNKFNPLYQEWHGLTDAEYEKLLMDFDPQRTIYPPETINFKELNFGLYESEKVSDFKNKNSPTGEGHVVQNNRLTEKTDVVKAEIGQNFGVKCIVSSNISTVIPIEQVWIFPDKMINEKGEKFTQIRWSSRVETNKEFGSTYLFEKDFEIIKGAWTYQVFFNQKKVLERKFYVK